MRGARQLIVGLLKEAGCDLPREGTLPPMDIAELTAHALLHTLADYAQSLGLEIDPSVTRSTVPPARSIAATRLMLIRLHVALEYAAVELGLEDLSLIDLPESQRQPLTAFLHRLRMHQTPSPKAT